MDDLAIFEQFDYIPTHRERIWGFSVASVGRQIEPPRPQQENKGRVLRDYSLVYLSDGHGMFKSHDAPWRRVHAGDVLMLFPGIWHDYHPSPETGWTAHWVSLNGELVNRWCMYDVLNVDAPVLHVGVQSELTEAFDRLIEIGRTAPPFANQIQSGMAMEILALVHKFQQNQQDHARSAPMIESALQYIAKNWAREIDFETLAGEMGVGYRHFRRQFQKAVGVAPHRYLLNLRLNHAKSLLRSHPVAEVASRVGFNDPLYFSRLFKRKVGVPPTRWH